MCVCRNTIVMELCIVASTRGSVKQQGNNTTGMSQDIIPSWVADCCGHIEVLLAQLYVYVCTHRGVGVCWTAQ